MTKAEHKALRRERLRWCREYERYMRRLVEFKRLVTRPDVTWRWYVCGKDGEWVE